MAEFLLNVFIYDNSRAFRHKLKKIVRNYAKDNNIKLGAIVYATQPNNNLNISLIRPSLYFLNIDDLDKTMDGIRFALNIRNNDLDGSIVFLTEHDIFVKGWSDLAAHSLRSHVVAMSFLAKDATEYESEVRECIYTHIRKISITQS